MALTAAAGVWWWCVGSESSDHHEVVTFADAAHANFQRELRKAEAQKKDALLAAIAEVRSHQETLQLLAQRQEESSCPSDVEAQILEEKRLLAKKSLEAGELLTQYMMKLDELPLGGNEALRARRKELLAEAGQLETELDSLKAK